MGIKTINKEYLAREVAPVLDLPILGRKGKAYDLVLTIFEVVKEALLRDEEVWVEGFGIFRWRTRPPTRSIVRCFTGGRRSRVCHTELVEFPAKRYVHFQPAKPLVRFVNEETDGN